MNHKKCNDCKHAVEKLERFEGSGKNNVEYIKKTYCDLGYRILINNTPGPRCDGKYFESK